MSALIDLKKIREFLVPFPVCRKGHTIDLVAGVVYLKHQDGGHCMAMPQDVYEEILEYTETP